MQLIPRAIVIGGFVPPAPPGQQQMTPERVNRVWSELAPAHGFHAVADDARRSQRELRRQDRRRGVTTQPPLIQVRSLIRTTTEQEAEDVRAIFAATMRHLVIDQLFNLGIKLIYSAPMPDNDAQSFVLRRVLSADEDRLADLATGSDGLWGGVKYVVPLQDRQYTLVLEPSQLDDNRSLFDLDAQFPGEIPVESITRRATDAQEYLAGPVDRYLNGLLELQ